MCRVFTLTIVCATAIAVSSTSAQPVLSRYRGVTLGDPVQVVVGDWAGRELAREHLGLVTAVPRPDRHRTEREQA